MQAAQQAAVLVHLGVAPVWGSVQFSAASIPVCLLSMETVKRVLVRLGQHHAREVTPLRTPAMATLSADTLVQ